MKSANIILTKMAAKTRFNKARFFGLMLVLLTIAATTLYSTSSASRGSVQTYLAAASGSMTGVSPLNARDLILPAIMNRESGGLHWFPGFSAVPQPPPNPNISIFASDCTTPQNTFHPGDTVCATITGIPLVLNIRVDWLGVTNLIQLRGSALGGDPQNVTFTLPTDAGLGAWHINVTSESDSSVRASEIFYVSNPATP